MSKTSEFHNFTHTKDFSNDISLEQFRMITRGLIDLVEYMENCSSNQDQVLYEFDKNHIRTELEFVLSAVKSWPVGGLPF